MTEHFGAPIALFVYKRPEHTRRTVEALQRNELAAASDLIIFSDGPKTPADFCMVAEVRSYLSTITGFKSVTVCEQETNRGLANSIIAGVTEVVNQYGRIIVLEDDLVTSPYFLRYMNEALVLYEHEEKVISIHGYTYPVKKQLPETFFLPGADCWGWATWLRGWALFESDSSKLLEQLQLKKLVKTFNVMGSYPFFKMLQDQHDGKIDSWAICWRASAVVNGKMTLYPGHSLVKNIGLDGSGIHCGTDYYYDTVLATRSIAVHKLPSEIALAAEKIYACYYHACPDATFMGRVIKKICKIFKIKNNYVR